MSEAITKWEAYRAIEKLVPPSDRIKKDASNAHDYWEKVADASDEITRAQILAAAKRCVERVGRHKQGLCHFLTGGWESYPEYVETPEPAPTPAAVEEAPVEATAQVDEIDAAFELRWARWPRHPQRPERPARAKSAWRGACQRRGIAAVTAAADAYLTWFSNPHNGQPFGKPMSKLLADDDEIDTQIDAAAMAPSTREATEFTAAYTAYPDFNGKAGKESGALQFWRRHVPEADRLAFLLACVAYGSARRATVGANPEAAQFTMGFNTFVADWRSHEFEVDWLAAALDRELAAAGRPLDDDHSEFLERCIGYFVVDCGKPLVEAVEATVRKLQTGPVAPAAGLDAAELAGRALEAAYISACKKLGIMLESRLDASRPGVADRLPPAEGLGR